MHPDQGGDPQRMAELNEAYRILSNSELRAEHDRALAEERRRGPLFDRLDPSTWAALCYLAPLPAFPVAYFIGRKGLWSLRFHAAQAALSLGVAVGVVVLTGRDSSVRAALAVGFAALHLALALLTRRDRRGTAPVELPALGLAAARLADVGGRRPAGPVESD
jgi:hypothetical protein